MVQRDISPNDNLEKLAREAQQLTLKRKGKIRNSRIVGLIKRESSGSDQIITQSYKRLKFPLLTTVHALNHWSTEKKMIAFINQC